MRYLSLILLRRAGLLLAGVLIAAACSSGGDGGTGPGPTPTIALSLASSGASVVQGASAQVGATLTRGGGFAGTVALTVEGAPSGVTGAVSNLATSGGTTTATVTVTVAAGTAPGLYNLTVRGTGAGVSAATAVFALTVTAAPDYSLSIAPTGVSVVQGQASQAIAVTITRTNFTSGVTLSLGGSVPVGVTAVFTPPAPESATASLVVTVAAATAPGTYNLSVNGTGTPGPRSTPFALTVTAAGSFTLSLTPPPATITLQQGTQDNSKTVNIARINYTAPITLTAEGLPSGVTAAFAGNPVSGDNSVMTLTATAGAPAVGPVTVTIRGTGPAALVGPGGQANLEATITFQLTVVPLGSFSVGMPASCAQNFQLRQGALDDRRIVTIARTNFALPITFSVEGLPTGLTAGFDVNPVSGDAIRLRFTADLALAAADYPITLRGTGPGGVSVTLPMVINIHAVTEPFDPNLLVYDFTAFSADGWRRGVLCPGPGLGNTDYGVGIFQEDMLVLDGRGPASNRQEANAWITRTIALPAGATVFRFNASAHFLDDARARVRVRVVDGATSTVVFNQVLTGSAPARTFQTYDANIAPWAGKTVRIFVEQLDDLASHGQLWLDTIRIF